MVLTTKKSGHGISAIPKALAIVTSAAAVASLVQDIFPGADGWRGIAIFAEASVGPTAGENGILAPSSDVGIAIAVTAMAGIAIAATLVYSSRRGTLKSPWSRRRRKPPLLAKQWTELFDEDGKLLDGGAKVLKTIRTAGVDPSIRADVWPFLLGMYDVKSAKRERSNIRAQKRKEYFELRRQCRQITSEGGRDFKMKVMSRNNSNAMGSEGISEIVRSLSLDEMSTSRPSVSTEIEDAYKEENVSEPEPELSDSYSSEEDPDITKPHLALVEYNRVRKSTPQKLVTRPPFHRTEDFAMWQRIIRLDALRANNEWIIHSPSQAAVSEAKAKQLALSVGLKDYSHLEPCRVYHAARLVAILEAYAVYDPEIGYCQGMSDLLSPIVSVIEEDPVAFWCFVGFMRKARHNFRLDEIGIRRQLDIVSKIIRYRDLHLYRHLEKLQAEDCFFVYRMVVVLFRRELNFEQTLSLWEVMWADQAAIRAGLVEPSWERMRMRPPPTDDLLLYAVAACVLQRKKLIIETYNSMDDIMRECNGLAGSLDVWKLLDDAHDLVVALHDKI